jgi:hypothetical protein
VLQTTSNVTQEDIPRQRRFFPCWQKKEWEGGYRKSIGRQTHARERMHTYIHCLGTDVLVLMTSQATAPRIPYTSSFHTTTRMAFALYPSAPLLLVHPATYHHSNHLSMKAAIPVFSSHHTLAFPGKKNSKHPP